MCLIYCFACTPDSVTFCTLLSRVSIAQCIPLAVHHHLSLRSDFNRLHCLLADPLQIPINRISSHMWRYIIYRISCVLCVFEYAEAFVLLHLSFPAGWVRCTFPCRPQWGVAQLDSAIAASWSNPLCHSLSLHSIERHHMFPSQLCGQVPALTLRKWASGSRLPHSPYTSNSFTPRAEQRSAAQRAKFESIKVNTLLRRNWCVVWGSSVHYHAQGTSIWGTHRVFDIANACNRQKKRLSICMNTQISKTLRAKAFKFANNVS